MPALSRTRTFFALLALALGGFGIGSTEFVTMGLLPEIARELIPGFDAHPEATIAHAGLLISAYALGVVVGAPITAVLAARVPQRTLVLWLLVGFIVMNALSAVMHTFELTALARFAAALPHGAYFGVASLLAARIMGPGKQGQGVALALSGLTIANVIGVPVFTWLGQAVGWRWAYVAVAVVFTLTLVLAFLSLPRVAGNTDRSALKELAAFRNPRLWLMIAVGAVGFGGFFAVYSYIAEVTTRAAGLDASLVPWVLATLGVGMTIGNILGGWASDRNLVTTLLWGFGSFIAALALFAMFAWHPVLLFVLAFLIGATSSTLIPSIQSRLIRIAGEAELLGAAVNHAAFNLGNSLGAWLGGVVIASGLGYLAPGWVGVTLAIAGSVLMLFSLRADARAAPTAADSAPTDSATIEA